MSEFIIGTGYHPSNKEGIYELWWDGVRKLNTPVYTLSTLPHNTYAVPNTIHLNHNLGHVSEFLSTSKKGLCGWSAHVLTLAMIAYSAGKGVIYLEQDVVLHGPVIETMLKEMGDLKFIFGKKHDGPPGMPCGQSVFIIKHDFLLRFVSAYLSFGEYETKNLLPEDRFVGIEAMYPDLCCRTGLGPERMRPIPFDTPIWYIQQCTQAEIDELKARNLI